MENWYLPITLVPGIGLLILSTSNLMVTLSNELNGLINEQSKDDSIILRKLTQLKTLNRVLVLFYSAVACLAIAGLIGGLQLISIKNTATYISVIGIVIMILGLFFLIKYSYRAVSIRQDQFKTIFNKN
jgi:DMSO reductase anchor subunit